MRHISDALELLTAQHEELDFLVVQVQQTYDADAFDELTDKLVEHLALEQELFYPVISSAMSNDVYTELLAEHGAIKRLLGDLVWVGVEDPSFGGKLYELANLVGGHSSWQEEQLFEVVAETIPAEQLADLGTQLQSFDSYVKMAA